MNLHIQSFGRLLFLSGVGCESKKGQGHQVWSVFAMQKNMGLGEQLFMEDVPHKFSRSGACVEIVIGVNSGRGLDTKL